jgi:hypothetical protein
VSEAAPAPGPERTGSWRPVVTALVAVVVLGLAAWLLLRDDGEGSREPGSPEAVSAAQIRDLSASVGHDVYWAGSQAAGTELELTHQADGRIYVRYLTGGAEVGDDRARFTTVGTYPVPAALAALRKQARGPAAITRTLPDGGLAYIDADRPTSIYLAWPGSDYEVEVFNPSPKRALDLVLAGAIAPVG